MELKAKLFADQERWIALGDPSVVLESITGLENRKEMLLAAENVKAAKAIIRDVGLGAKLSVGSSPSVIITRAGTSETSGLSVCRA